MIVGHYGASFACKSAARTLPLWLLFLAVQFVDTLWCVFILLGIEKARLVHGALDLYYMPYTHSLDGALLWSVVAAAGYLVFARRTGRHAAVPAFFLGLAVFSHWILDLLVHRRDLPLYDNAYKVGFALYSYPVLEFSLEAVVLALGLWLYSHSASASSFAGKYGFLLFGVGLLALQWRLFVVGPPLPPKTIAVILLILYVVFAATAGWLEKLRHVDESSH
jgi:hypothetical protein